MERSFSIPHSSSVETQGSLPFCRGEGQKHTQLRHSRAQGEFKDPFLQGLLTNSAGTAIPCDSCSMSHVPCSCRALLGCCQSSLAFSSAHSALLPPHLLPPGHGTNAVEVEKRLFHVSWKCLPGLLSPQISFHRGSTCSALPLIKQC